MALGPWSAWNLRFTLFASDGPAADAGLETATGLTADGVENRRKEGIEQANVMSGTGMFVFGRSPGRFDFQWIVAPQPATEAALRLPPLGQVLHPFLASSQRLLESWPASWTRIALAGSILIPATSYEDGFNKLRPFLSLIQSSATSAPKDFTYRSNWPSVFTVVPGGYLNRITTFSVARIDVAGSPITNPSSSISRTHFASQIEFDFNSPAEHPIAGSAGLGIEILKKLSTLLEENADRGEVQS